MVRPFIAWDVHGDLQLQWRVRHLLINVQVKHYFSAKKSSVFFRNPVK